jgi:hypothetical protein
MVVSFVWLQENGSFRRGWRALRKSCAQPLVTGSQDQAK